MIGDARTAIVSSASLWEIAIKSAKTCPHAIGLALPFDVWIDRLTDRNAYRRLDILEAHLKRVATLPPHHGDPFDRLLVAQALVEGIPIVSADATLDAYGVQCIW